MTLIKIIFNFVRTFIFKLEIKKRSNDPPEKCFHARKYRVLLNRSSYKNEYLTKSNKLLKNKTLYLDVIKKRYGIINYIVRNILSLNKFSGFFFN